MTDGVPRRELPRLLAAATGLSTRAAPGTTLAYGAGEVVAGLLPVAAAWLFKLLLDDITQHRGPLGPALALAALGVVAAVLPLLSRYLRGQLDRAVGLLALDRLYQAMNRMAGIARMEDPAFRDRLRMAQEAGRSGPSQLLDDALGGVRGTLTLAGFLGTLLLVSPVMSALVLAAAVPAFASQLRLSRARAAVLWTIAPTERRELFYSELLGSLAAAKEVRLLGLGDLFRRRMLAETAAGNAARAKQDRRELRVHAALAGLSTALAGAGLVWAVRAGAAGRLSVGDVTVFVAAVAGVQGAVQDLVDKLGTAHHALLLFGHYRAVEEAGPDLPGPAQPRPVPPLRDGVELRDVWFRYAPDQPWVLRGVDLVLPRGCAVALVGLNGAGKSTLVKLLCRFYDPTRGAVLWDGIDVRELPVDQLRERIGVLFQDFMQYDLSAAENVGVGDVATLGDRDPVVAAARRAGAHETLAALPRGYDTLLSRLFFDETDRADPETGVLLSGGQWQRVALARTLLRDRRDLLILDEPSSGLDAEAEHEVHRQLREHRDGRTSVLISHRLGAVRDADRIVVLAGGRVVEQGRHEELLVADRAYARLFRLQAAGYRPVDEPVAS